MVEMSDVLVEGGKRPSATKDLRVREILGANMYAELGRFNLVLEALPVAIYTTDAAGRITFYNQAAVELRGGRRGASRRHAHPLPRLSLTVDR